MQLEKSLHATMKTQHSWKSVNKYNYFFLKKEGVCKGPSKVPSPHEGDSAAFWGGRETRVQREEPLLS